MIKQVTSLTNSSVATILTPSDRCKLIIIQNNGSGNVRMTFDGGSTFTNPYTNTVGTDPTTTATGTGYKLAAGAQITLNMLAGGGGLHFPIRAILETATTTTLDICTDDTKSI